MKILLISNTCSKKEFENLQNIKFAEKISPQQNYFSMLIEGLLGNNNSEVTCITVRSIASSNTNVAKMDAYHEKISNKLSFRYTKVIAHNWLRNINNYFQVRREIKNYLGTVKNEENVCAVIDPLAFDVTLGAISVLKKIRKVALVTDIPMFIDAIEKDKKNFIRSIKGRFKQNIFMSSMGKMDGFCFLTKYMNIINPNNKPYCIIEGMVPNDMEERDTITPKTDKRVIMYAGGLYEKFGINDLVDAVTELKGDNFELHLYGEGNSVDYIKSVAKENDHIKYNGVVSTDEIRLVECEASILINPRSNTEEYTKYSFPSKTLEYMSSGRPVMTMRLLGIPEEYFQYCYVIEKSGKEGIKQALSMVLSLSDEELDKKGQAALKFVSKEKESVKQANKLIDLMKMITD